MGRFYEAPYYDDFEKIGPLLQSKNLDYTPYLHIPSILRNVPAYLHDISIKHFSAVSIDLVYMVKSHFNNSENIVCFQKGDTILQRNAIVLRLARQYSRLQRAISRDWDRLWILLHLQYHTGFFADERCVIYWFNFLCIIDLLFYLTSKRPKIFSNDSRDDPIRVQEWKDADIHYDNLILENDHAERKYPFKQQYPGRGAGLSVILDPDLDEYYCTNTDSEGFVVALNVPLDFPRMRDNGIAIRTNSEVFMSVRPEITLPDETIKQFPLNKRQCYFSDEHKLPHYTKYTTSNCVDECVTWITRKNCNCTRYYMPRKCETDMPLTNNLLLTIFYHVVCK